MGVWSDTWLFLFPLPLTTRHIEMGSDGVAEYLRPGTMTELLHGWLIGWPVWGGTQLLHTFMK